MQAALIFPRRTSAGIVDKLLEASPRMNAHARLAIYQHSYHARLLRCMDEQFPALRHALGAPLFADFAGEYLRACPSQSYTLYELGARFPAYLEESRPDRDLPAQEREDWIDFMVDLATFEREVFRLYDAPGQEGKPYATADLPDDSLTLQACVSLHEFRYPVADYYTQVRRKLDPAYPPARRSFYALVRRDFLTRMIPLERTHHQFLTMLAQGQSVDDALTSLADSIGQAREAVVRAWSARGGSRESWVRAGMFVARGADLPSVELDRSARK
ncbi:MAG: putative DNA-binding domain-containing protein [Betaproteobacteria bacterium]|nr:putative DNA-binding domain-containing protein [Betaproteobacteria bacterium]